MSLTKRMLLACAIGLLITAASALPWPHAEKLFWPGLAFSALFWPEGIHSDFGGDWSVVLMLGTVLVATLTVWTAISYMLLIGCEKMHPVIKNAQARI